MAKMLSIEEEPRGQPGIVAIRVTHDHLPDVLTVSVTSKAGDGVNLGPAGWQAKPHAFTPEAIEDVPGGRLLFFGPAMTAYVAVDKSVTVAIPELGVSERHFWPAIATAPDGAGVDISVPGRKAAPITAGGRPAPLVTPTIEDDRTEKETAPPETIPAPVAVPARSRRPIYVLAGLLLLLGAAAIAYVFFFDEARETQIAADLVDSSAGPGFRERYEAYRRVENGHAEDLVALSREAMDAGEDEVGFLAMTLAADRGSADGQEQLAEWYDPLADGESPVAPNAATAALYYRDAAGSGNTSALDRLRRLCEAVGSRAGDPSFETLDVATYCSL